MAVNSVHALNPCVTPRPSLHPTPPPLGLGLDCSSPSRPLLQYPQDIEGLNIASKDTTQSARDMWTALLTASNNKAAARRRAAGGGGSRAAAAGSGGAGAGGGGSGELGELCNKLQDFGDYDLVGLLGQQYKRGGL